MLFCAESRREPTTKAIDMSWLFYFVLLACGFWTFPAPSEAYIARSTGCHHNGTWYADKSLVPTVEKCLNCQCNRKTLVCRLKVCPEMPMPPPRGCVVVEKRNTCCPYLSCARLEAFYKIPITRRIIAYLDHYERESIDRVVNDNMLQRRSDDSDSDLQVCVKNGTVYKSGSAMSSSNLCSYCYCIGGTEKCVKPKCMLPVEGCKPIFVDSTCCPVRYDCSAKTSGKSSQEMRYRKTSNKHFLRMSQRLQRNRGCTVNKQFYAEGQKMKSDADKPCDICFCIRGSRRCAPKKCSPALKNCMPVVPKGQCCPSSYDCGSQRDYRRSQNSRQFNLFSLLFGKDESKPGPTNDIAAQYPHDRDPALTSGNTFKTHEAALEASSEKSIMDTIREGLEFIDGNTNHMLEENSDLVNMQAKRENIQEAKNTTAEASNGDVSSTTELSFLDLILGETSDSPNEDDDTHPTTPTQNELSWVDILLGPDEDQKNNTPTATEENAMQNETSNFYSSVDRLDTDVDELGSSGEIIVGAEMPIMDSSIKYDFSNSLFKNAELNKTKVTNSDENIKSARNQTSDSINQSTVEFFMKNTTSLSESQQPVIKPIPLHESESKPATTVTEVPYNPSEDNHLLSAILEGISGMLGPENQTLGTSTEPTTELPVFKPLPVQKTHTRINSKIASLVVSPPPIIINSNQTKNKTFKPLPDKPVKPTNILKANLTATTEKMLTSTLPTTTTTTTPPKPTTKKLTTSVTALPKTTTASTTTPSTTTTASTTTKTSTTTTTPKPLIIKINPTILETEPLDDSIEPTLPPSLPNLKIIPFLPTDAVEADIKNPHDYFPGSASLYEDPKLYSDMENHYATFSVDLDDENKAKYIYKFKVEGPDTDVIPKSPADLGADSFLSYELTEKNRFSPPTKTEGGFVPKDPLAIDDGDSVISGFNASKLNEISPATMHLIDITTTEPLESNLTKIIEITTPDPFRDVIHTEPPPDLALIIQDKEKIEAMTKNLTNLGAEFNSTQSPLQRLEFNSSIMFGEQEMPTSTPPRTKTEKIQVNTSSIEALLDMFLKEETDSSNQSSTTSTLPPFKRLPQTTMDQLSIKSTTTESTARLQSPTTIKSNQTTKKPFRTKSTQATGSKNRIKSNTTRKPTALPSIKDNKHKINKTTTTKTTTTTQATTKATTISAPIAVASAIKTTKPSISSSKPTKSTALKIATTNAATTPTGVTHNPFLMSPFDKLPFMDASFEVKRRAHTTPAAPTAANPEVAHTLERLEGLNAAYEVSNAISSSTTTTSVHPPHASSSVSEKHSTSFSNGLIDPTGILKLAGCNIYGRMYRVGRIILELSSPCVECKCTETGVACGQLDC